MTIISKLVNISYTGRMNVSAKTVYACLAMLELASQYGADRPVRISEIARLQDVPPRFLVQILLQLKRAGLVVSTRGAAGGYHMTVPPEEISLGQVMDVIGNRTEESRVASQTASHSPAAEVLVETWRDVAAVEREMLDDISLADLLKRARGRDESMYYI